MGVFHWSESPNAFSSPYEWAMKNFSTKSTVPSIEQETKKEEDEEIEKPRFDWDLSLSAVVSSKSGPSSDILGAIAFDSTERFVATAGISRKIRFYDLNSLLSPEIDEIEDDDGGVRVLDHAKACEYYICTPAKLSSLIWRPVDGDSDCRIIGAGDYDGVVTEYDVETRVPVFERDEHGGRRVWSVDYTRFCDSRVGASGSDDGTMQMWDTRCDGAGSGVAVVRPGAGRSSVCCVEFEPSGGDTVAVGCADRKAYVYDIRKLVDPTVTLEGHAKTVAYVRHLDSRTIVTAGTDGCLKLWNTNDARVIRTYQGHANSRNFVGLSVWRDGGLFGCGSENNRVFVYDRRWGEPVWAHGLQTADGSGLERRFVSSVCWKQICEDTCTLLAGGSDGLLQVYVGKRKP